MRLEKVVIPSNISIIMKKYLLILITFILTTNLHGQYIRVLDEDNKPVPDVAVYDNTRSSLTYTSRTGRVAISAFSRAGAICFQHFAFDTFACRRKRYRPWTTLSGLRERFSL